MFAFLRMLAKIAHCYAAWRFGVGGFSPLLVPLIREPDKFKTLNEALVFVGGVYPHHE